MAFGPSATSASSLASAYDGVDRSSQGSYQQYYNGATNYAPSSPVSNQHVYSSTSPNGSHPFPQLQGQRPAHMIPRPQSTMPAYNSSHSYSLSYSQTPIVSTSGIPQVNRVRSNSQAYNRLPSPPNTLSSPPHQYQEIPIPHHHQTIGLSSDYPTSPSRPFACDLCALSFNRQHDLKRHRETHSGEKPYLCNGGCGKTFTRKDALKRHQVRLIPTSIHRPVLTLGQLVKGCGKVEDSWS